jgi:hypothetical protein
MQSLRASGGQAAWLVIGLLLLLSGCVYPYDDGPYGYGTYGANPGNCGTPYEPKSCSEYSAPLNGYQYTQPGQQYAPPQYTPPQYAPPQYAPPQYAPPQSPPPQYSPSPYAPPQYPPQQYGAPTPLSPDDPYGRGTYPPPPASRPDYTPSYPPSAGYDDRDSDGADSRR